MALPNNFSGNSSEEPHRFFRNLCIEFKRLVQSSQDVEKLHEEMEKLYNTGKQMHWNHKKSSIYHKTDDEKLMGKIYREYKRYSSDLKKNPQMANPQDLIDSIEDLKKFIDSFKVY